MRRSILFCTSVFIVFTLGCGSTPTTGGKNAKNDDANTLSATDKSLVAAQGYCVVSEEALGSMGVPLKILAKDQPVFVCCKACEKTVRDKPEEMLVKRDEMRAKVATERPR